MQMMPPNRKRVRTGEAAGSKQQKLADIKSDLNTSLYQMADGAPVAQLNAIGTLLEGHRDETSEKPQTLRQKLKAIPPEKLKELLKTMMDSHNLGTRTDKLMNVLYEQEMVKLHSLKARVAAAEKALTTSSDFMLQSAFAGENGMCNWTALRDFVFKHISGGGDDNDEDMD